MRLRLRHISNIFIDIQNALMEKLRAFAAPVGLQIKGGLKFISFSSQWMENIFCGYARIMLF
jgi:hypothetical protein